MGALHAGHASLTAEAGRSCDDVAVSIFVNCTQFGPEEDFARYPRPLAADLALLDSLGVRWAFTPSVAGMYPDGQGERVPVDGPAQPFEGAIRPGHFSGVATVVKRLFEIVPADVAFFGAKDWQQTRVITRLVHDRAIPIRIVTVPTVREPDGLALSSRNAYLTPAERSRAVALHAGLVAAEARWIAGERAAVVEAALREALEARDIACDYAAIVDPESLAPLRDPRGPAIALVARGRTARHDAAHRQSRTSRPRRRQIVRRTRRCSRRCSTSRPS